MNKKHIVVLLAAALTAGCGTEQETAEVEITIPILKEKTQEIADALEQQDFKTVSASFSRDSAQSHSASALKKLMEETGGSDTIESGEIDVDCEEDRHAGYLSYTVSGTPYYAVMEFDSSLKLVSLQFEETVSPPVPLSTDAYSEIVVKTGEHPSLYGILTIPAGDDVWAPAAVLMPEGIQDGMNASGSDPAFRSDLAHALAEQGIASLRYDMRGYEDPSIMNASNASLDRQVFRDFASGVHMLERYHVDASTILYIGHGMGGTAGYRNVYSHFEISGGLVLLNSPYENGAEMMQQTLGIASEDIASARQAISASPESTLSAIDGYPLSYYAEWDSISPLNYTRYVSQPIAILQGTSDASVSETDWNGWAAQKGHNVSMKQYEGLDHFMRSADGTIAPEVIADIVQWLNGEDIEEDQDEA